MLVFDATSEFRQTHDKWYVQRVLSAFEPHYKTGDRVWMINHWSGITSIGTVIRRASMHCVEVHWDGQEWDDMRYSQVADWTLEPVTWQEPY